MAQQYFGILTAIGESKDANAKALGLPLVFTHLAVGDGNGNVPVPDRMRDELVNEMRRAPINQISIDPNNPNQIVIEQVIPENEGGWWIREMGLIDEAGDLIAICNCPPSYKPQLIEGSGRTQVVRMVLIFASAATVQLKVDPSVVLATRKYANDAITVAMQGHAGALDPHPQYWNDLRGLAKVDARLMNYPRMYSILNLPPQNVGPIMVVEACELWQWVETDYFAGYRHPHCGRPLDGHTVTPLITEIDAVGGVLNKVAYARLWGYAQENNLVVTQAIWNANIGAHYFVDVDADSFRVPDLRNMFRRFTGTDADTANARTLGSRQFDQFKLHDHNVAIGRGTQGNTSGSSSERWSSAGPTTSTQSGGAETRPVNTAYAPRIHA